MGSTDHPLAVSRLETPAHLVEIAEAFAVSKFEITWEEWQACRAENACGTGASRTRTTSSIAPRFPVSNVTWSQAHEYIDWINSRVDGSPYRLLTEAEWEYAARAGTTSVFSNGGDESQVCEIANGMDSEYGDTWSARNMECADGHRYAAPVGSFRENDFGLHDMHGNVFEWVEDCWNSDYVGAPGNGDAWISGDCSRRVVRGGSWFSAVAWLRPAARGNMLAEQRRNYTGFRIARDL